MAKRSISAQKQDESELNDLKLTIEKLNSTIKTLSQQPPKSSEDSQVFSILANMRQSMQQMQEQNKQTNELFMQSINNFNSEVKSMRTEISDLRGEGRDNVSAMARMASEVTDKLAGFNEKIYELEVVPHCTIEEKQKQTKINEYVEGIQKKEIKKNEKVDDLKWEIFKKIALVVVGLLLTIVNIPNILAFLKTIHF